jgi:hypothetical protein
MGGYDPTAGGNVSLGGKPIADGDVGYSTPYYAGGDIGGGNPTTAGLAISAAQMAAVMAGNANPAMMAPGGIYHPERPNNPYPLYTKEWFELERSVARNVEFQISEQRTRDIIGSMGNSYQNQNPVQQQTTTTPVEPWQLPGDDEYATGFNKLTNRDDQLTYLQRRDDPLARISYAQRYGREPLLTTSDIAVKWSNMAGFVPPAEIGDSKTNELVAGFGNIDPLIARMRAIEMQRQGAVLTPGLLDDRFYGNELSRITQAGIQRASAAHNLMNEGWAPYAGNPYAAQGDTLLEIQKGYPLKGAESPLSFSTPLPMYQGKPAGIQDAAWSQALQNDRGQRNVPMQGSYLPSIELANERLGQIYQGIGVSSPLTGDYRRIQNAPYREGLSFAENGQIRVEPTGLSPTGVGTHRYPSPGMSAPGISQHENDSLSKPLAVVANVASPYNFIPLPESAGLPSIMRVGKPIPTSPEETFRQTLLKEAPATFSMAGSPMGFYAGAYSIGSALRDVPGAISGLFGKSPSVPMASEYTKKSEAYQANLTDYNSQLVDYDTRLKSYNAKVQENPIAPDEPTYTGLMGEKSILDSEKINLDGRKAVLDDEYSALNTERTSLLTQQKRESEIDPWGKLNEGIAHGSTWGITPDLKGFGERARQGAIALNYGKENLATESIGYAAGGVEGLYGYARNKPLDALVMYGIGKVVFPAVEYGISAGIAKAASTKIPIISGAGRAFSSPIGLDAGNVAKAGMFGLYGAGEFANILSRETTVEKGIATGEAVGGFSALMIGAKNPVIFPVVKNPYQGIGFFGGKPAMSPLEKTMFKTETTIRSLTTSNPSAYRDVAKIAPSGRFIEPMVRADPDIAATSRAGPYAPEIIATLQEQPHSVFGSVTVRNQYPERISDMFSLRAGKDVDVLIQSPKTAISSLSRRTGLTPKEVEGVLDPHAIPKKYPRFSGSTEAEPTTTEETSLLSDLFGDPYRRIAVARTESEVVIGDKLNFEQVQAQFGRKSQAVSKVIEDPIQKGYRAEKDVFDFVGLYQAQRAVALERGTPTSAFKKSDAALERLMSTKLTLGTVKGQRAGDANPTRTTTIGELYKEGKGTSSEPPAPRIEVEHGYIPRAASTVSGAGAASAIPSAFKISSPSSGGRITSPSSSIGSRFPPSPTRSSSPSSPARSSPTTPSRQGISAFDSVAASMFSGAPTPVSPSPSSPSSAKVSTPSIPSIPKSGIPTSPTSPLKSVIPSIFPPSPPSPKPSKSPSKPPIPETPVPPISLSWDSDGGVSGYHKTRTTKHREQLAWWGKPGKGENPFNPPKPKTTKFFRVAGNKKVLEAAPSGQIGLASTKKKLKKRGLKL